nr:hypothetical protein [Tanacetum cinerariifolium]
MDKSESYLAASEHRECYDGLIKSYELNKTLFSTHDEVCSLKRIQKDKGKDEDPSARSDRRLKKKKITKDVEPTKGLKAKESQSGSSKGNKSQSKSSIKSVQSEEPEFEVADSNMPQDQEENPGPAFKLLKGTRSNYAELECDSEECYKALSEKLDWDNPKGGDYPFDLNKPLPLVMIVTQVKVMQKHRYGYLREIEVRRVDNDPYTFKEVYSLKRSQKDKDEDQSAGSDRGLKKRKTIKDVAPATGPTAKESQSGSSKGIKDMVPNIWSLVKVAYDKHALWGILHRREQRKTFYGYARGLQSIHDVYSMKLILAVTQVEVMRKHGYEYLKKIVVRRSDNDLYRFKEGEFPCLRINAIEDMLLLVQNRHTNLSGMTLFKGTRSNYAELEYDFKECYKALSKKLDGENPEGESAYKSLRDDVFDFAITLRMFTRSLVIQKRVEDLQLRVESYQKKINITKPETTKSEIRKRDRYTPYQNPQGFIYVDNNRRNSQNQRDIPRDIPLVSVEVL